MQDKQSSPGALHILTGSSGSGEKAAGVRRGEAGAKALASPGLFGGAYMPISAFGKSMVVYLPPLKVFT